jgi:uncharacterized small protein (DUF1192 family)
MTPMVTITDDEQHGDRRRGSKSQGGGVSMDTIKFIVGMVLAALVSYFSTTYGLQARIDVLEARLKASEINLQAVQSLTGQVAELNQRLAVLTAIVERMERQQQQQTDGARRSRQFDH